MDKKKTTPSNPRKPLIAAAVEASRMSRAAYSGFQVGAALLTRSGAVITGANVESASYGLTCCAERVALFKALTEGHDDFRAIAVVAPLDGGAMPCGACRQLLAEYAPEAVIWVADSRSPGKSKTFTVREILPGAFKDFRKPEKVTGALRPGRRAH